MFYLHCANNDDIFLVLTALELNIVIFPFTNACQPLVNVVELEEFQLWNNRHMLDIDVLKLRLALMDEKSCVRSYSTEVNDADIPHNAQVAKSHEGCICLTGKN